MVGEINHLHKLQNEGVIKALLFLKEIYNLKAKPQGTKAYKEERYNASKQSIDGYTKHNVWPILVQSIYRSNRGGRLIGLC